MNDKQRMSTHDSLKAVSYKLFQVISDELDVNSAYVTQLGSTELEVISSFNKDHYLIPEGFVVDYDGAYCRLIFQSDNEVVQTNVLSSFALTKHM